MTDTNALKAKMMGQGLRARDLATKIGMSNTSLSYKINNTREFKSSEIKRIQHALKLTDDEFDLKKKEILGL